MNRARATGSALLVLGLAAACGSDRTDAEQARYDEAVRIVTTVSTAISFPRQDSADGYARAAIATAAGQDGRLTVIAADPVDDDGSVQPRIATLVYRIAVGAGEPICLTQDYDRYGPAGEPEERTCLAGAVAVTPPPAPPAVVIPVGADTTVERVLRGTTDAAAVQRRLVARFADLPAPPTVTAARDAEVLAVSVAGEPGSCLLGTRRGAEVETWYLSREQAMPGELGCSPDTAITAIRTSR